MSNKKAVDKNTNKKHYIEGDASEPKYLSQEELHKFEVADLKNRILKLELDGLKLTAKLAEAQADKHKAELAYYNSRRELLLHKKSEATAEHREWTASLCAKYGVESIDGYNPLSGEILVTPSKPPTT